MTRPRAGDVYAVLRSVARRAVLIVRSVKEVNDVLRHYSLPTWVLVPDHIPEMPAGMAPDEFAPIEGELGTADLDRSRATIARLMADIADQSAADDPEQLRPIPCWLSVESEDVVIHVGRECVGRVQGSPVRPIRAAVERWGGSVKALCADADLYGSSPDTAHLTFWLTSRPVRR